MHMSLFLHLQRTHKYQESSSALHQAGGIMQTPLHVPLCNVGESMQRYPVLQGTHIHVHRIIHFMCKHSDQYWASGQAHLQERDPSVDGRLICELDDFTSAR